ncbi:MAG TPA: ROK family protein, partial [Arachidicoccus soli]|nr:ROK family protein [Arachidicoccus soli]
MLSIPISQQMAIGIDIGGTNTVFGIVDHRGEINYRGAITTNKHEKIEDYIEELYQAILPSLNQFGSDKLVRGIGIGAPNGNYYSGEIEYAPNLRWPGKIPLVKLIQERFNLPSALTNDANAAAVGEMTYGAAKGMKD